MSDNAAIAILVVGFFGFVAWSVSIFGVVVALATQTNANNWILGLAAWGTSMVIGLPLNFILKALKG